jgi:molecular chaperone GrpE
MTEEQKSEVHTDDTLAKLQQEVEDYKNKYLRALADMENLKKRLMKEKQEMVRFGVENVIAEILLPIDNLENALKHAQSSSAEVKNWALGFEMILSQLKEVLINHGIAPFNSIGVTFDPHLHEAVEVEETDSAEEGTILQEFIKGYRCGDRPIRPARVKVAKRPEGPKQQKEIQGE